MKKVILLNMILTCALVFKTGAQVNLVINPSFESYTNCPTTGNQIQYARYWSSIDSNGNPDSPWATPICTPELECTCDSTGSQSDFLPMNIEYYHYPRTGNAMCQMLMYGIGSIGGIDNYYHRDYTQGRLSTPLAEGASYCVTFYVALEEGSGYAVNNIGAYIDDGSIDTGMYDTCCYSTLGVVDTYCTQPKSMYTPQILDTNVVLDTLGRSTNDSALYERRWVTIQGSFVANGHEKYITIGVFADDAHTHIVSLPPPPPYFYISAGWSTYHNPYAAYLIDDVSVVRSDAVADAGPDTVYISAAGDSIWIGNDTAAVGGGAGMPCWWYKMDSPTVAIDSGGRVLVHPGATTTYIMKMELCGNVTYDTITVKIGTTSTSIINNKRITIFPNPATNELNITGVPPNVKYAIWNPLGQTMLKGALDSGVPIDILRLSPGMYFVELTDVWGNRRVMKFCKM